MQDYTKLNIWTNSHELVLKIYKITEDFPRKEEYRLTSQLIRAATSIPANIAEGSAKTSKLDFKRFLSFSIGSASEVEYYLLLAKDLSYISEDLFQELKEDVVIIRKSIIALTKKI